MSTSAESVPEQSKPTVTLPEGFDLSEQFALFLQSKMNPSPPVTKMDNLVIKVKLNSNNYPLWCNLMKRALLGRGMSAHITGISPIPLPTDPAYPKWEQEDQLVFTWLIDNIEDSLVSNASRYPTAKGLWDGLAITYGSGSDNIQVFDFHRQANSIRQGDQPLDECWRKLQDLWMLIDIKEPNPMECEKDINVFNRRVQEHRLYQLLTVVSDKYSSLKRDLLKREPLPSAEVAYNEIRRSDVRDGVLLEHPPSVLPSQGVGFELTTKGPVHRSKGPGDLIKIPQGRGKGRGTTSQSGYPSSREEKNNLICSHCGQRRHTVEQCFKLHGFPDWWETHKAALKLQERGKVSIAKTCDGQEDGSHGNGGEKEEHQSNVPENSGIQGGRKGAGENPTPLSHLYNKNLHFTPPVLHNIDNQPSIKATNSSLPSQFHLSHDMPQQLAKTPNIPSIIPKIARPAPTFACTAHSPLKSPHWIFDCGATDTMTYDPTDFTTFTLPQKESIETANGQIVHVSGGGTIPITPQITLSNCLYVPSLSNKLLSISQLTKTLDCVVLMYPNFCLLQDIHTKEIIGRGTEKGGLYYVDTVALQEQSNLAIGSISRQLWLWHRRLGHTSFSYLQKLFPNLFPNNVPLPTCETCLRAKQPRVTYRSNHTRVSHMFDLVHSDVWGPSPVTTPLGFQYFIIFVDDYSRMTWIYLLKHKSEVTCRFVEFYKMIQHQYHTCIKILRSDNGGEYIDGGLQHFLRENGLIHQTSCPDTAEQNGVAERKNRTLLEMTRAMMFESNVPLSFWPEAVVTAAYLINRLPTSILHHKTPIQTLSLQTNIPSIDPKVFGCTVYTHVPRTQRHKLEPCAEKCVFVGYSSTQKGYRCYNPRTRKILVTMNCVFVETEYYYETHTREQGESLTNGSLPWLPGLTEPTGQVGGADSTTQPADVQIPSHVQVNNSPSMNTPEQTVGNTDTTTGTPNLLSSVLLTEPVSEINDYHLTDPITDIVEDGSNNIMQEPVRVLPPRPNRGVPPNRYSPTKIAKASRYPLHSVRRNVSKNARALFTSLCSEVLPHTVDEAARQPEWKAAMDTEMDALKKIRHGKSASSHQERRQ